MKKNTQITASLVKVDENGEQVGPSAQWSIVKPEIIDIESSFAKIHFKEFEVLSNAQRGRFIPLLNHLEYETNRLVFKNRGKVTVPLNQRSISKIIGLKIRQGGEFIVEMIRLNAIIRIKKYYYVNPRFAMRSKGIRSDIIAEMMRIEPEIVNILNTDQYKSLKHFI